MRRLQVVAIGVWCALLGSPAALHAAEQVIEEHKQIWDIELGQRADVIPPRTFMEIACGTNGGPPSTRLKGFTEFKTCRAEATGLHEVYFEYDDDWLYRARARQDFDLAARLGGTRAFGFDAIVSLLIDDDGVVQGLRVVTDPRAPDAQREVSFVMARSAMGRFGFDGWDCTDFPRREGYAPTDRGYVDQACHKVDAVRQLFVSAQHFRKPGQAVINPFNGRPNPASQAFESTARFEMFSAAVRLGERP